MSALSPEEKAACDLVERMLREVDATTVYTMLASTSMTVRLRNEWRPIDCNANSLANAIERARQIRSETP